MDHLTPDVLAAWLEGTLSDAERSAAEGHAADCARCQTTLAAMVRTMPAKTTRAWWSVGTVRWLVPIAAAVLIVATYVAVQQERVAAPVAPVGSASARSTVPEAAQREVVPPAASAAPAEPQTSLSDAKAKPQAKNEIVNSRARDFKDAPRREKAAKVDAMEVRADTAAPSNAPAAAAEAKPPAQTPVQSRAEEIPLLPPRAQPVAGQALSAPSAPPPPPAALPIQEAVTVVSKDEALRKSTARGALDAAGAAGARTVEVISPERSYHWRAVTPGSIQYSIDGGINWRSSPAGTTVVMRAGSSPAPKVCWLVGQAGTVLLTTDGQTWQARPFPQRVELTDVHATDAKTATVTTVDQRRFATTDGGATWSPLQEN